jgi:hypothetical protein
VASGSNEIDEIYQRMAVIRREHHTNVRESVAGAEAMADWGRYTWTYPWIALGAAVAVGYSIYTSGRQKSAGNTVRLADGAEAGEPVTGVGASGQERSWRGRNLLLAAWDILSPVAVRAGQNYVLHLLEQQFRPRTVDQAAPTQSTGDRRASMSRAEW